MLKAGSAEVLIVDDDVELLRQLAFAFVRAGHEVRCAVDGEKALAKFDAAPPDAVVIDLIMPVREGIETIMAMRARRPEAKILAISGGLRRSPETFLNMALRLGADAMLAKPFLPSEAVAAVRRLVGARADDAAA
jgi:DNA-binding response OmpR family regulator